MRIGLPFISITPAGSGGMAENYELCLDSGKLGIDGTGGCGAGLSGTEEVPMNSGQKVYFQVVEYIKELVKTGEVEVGGRLPSERELMERLDSAEIPSGRR